MKFSLIQNNKILLFASHSLFGKSKIPMSPYIGAIIYVKKSFQQVTPEQESSG